MTTMSPEMTTEEAHDQDTGEVTPPAPAETPEEAAKRAEAWAAKKIPPSSGPATPAPASAMGVDPSQADWALGLQPRDAADAYEMARAFHASGLYRKKFDSVDAIWTVILLGREHGLSALAALQSLTIIEGKVEMDAALIVAKVIRSGAAIFFRLIESTDERATWETRRAGDEKPIRMSFSVQDAQRRGLFVVQKDGTRTTATGRSTNWQKMPDVMCMWRAATKLARAIYPDVIRGLYGQGEVREAVDVPDDLLAGAEKARAAQASQSGGAQPQRRAG